MSILAQCALSLLHKCSKIFSGFIHHFLETKSIHSFENDSEMAKIDIASIDGRV